MLNDYKNNYITNLHDKKRLITLVGMMGTGKSKFGYLVSKSLKCCFYDTDNLIEKELNTSIKNIFKSYGETFFRNIEKEKIKTIINNIYQSKEQAILSVGGGAFDDNDSRNLLLKFTKVIWLNTPVETLVKRIGDGHKRPMITGNVVDSINKILEKRLKYYSLSHYKINTENFSQEQITQKIKDIILK